MAAPAKSVLNMIKDLQEETAALRNTVASILQEVARIDSEDVPGSNTDIVARLETLESILWGKDE